jgi:hypothetical protein
LERLLYCWAIRHPASGYVQGINDICTPFFQVFLSDFLSEEDIGKGNTYSLTDETLAIVEADTFWCLSKLLDGIQVRAFSISFFAIPCISWLTG